MEPFGGGQQKDVGAAITALQTQQKLSWQIIASRMLQEYESRESERMLQKKDQYEHAMNAKQVISNNREGNWIQRQTIKSRGIRTLHASTATKKGGNYALAFCTSETELAGMERTREN